MRGTRTIVTACALMLATTLAPPGVAAEQEVRLTLGDALRTALENNLDLLAARKDPKIAAQNIIAAKGIFDAHFFAGFDYGRSAVEGSAFSSSAAETISGNVGVRHVLNFGADYSVSLGSTRQRQIGGLPSFCAVPQFAFSSLCIATTYNSGLSATFNLPLLKGFGKTVNTQPIVAARSAREISRLELLRRAQTTMETVEDAYWDLVAGREAVRVAQKSLTLAKDLYDLNKKKVEVGTLAPIEITQAEAGVASREEGVIVAETGLATAEDNLRRLLGYPKDSPVWGQTLTPTDSPSFEPKNPDLEASISKALDARPELAGAREDLRNRELSEKVAKNALLPDLKLVASVNPSGNNIEPVILAGPDGIIGTDDDIGGTELDDSLGSSLKEIPSFSEYRWNVGLSLDLPLRSRKAKAEYAAATLSRERAEISVQNVEQTVQVEVRIAVRNVESGAKRVAAARANTVLQQKKLEAEQKKFENGMSTSFEVLTFQNDLANAQLAEIRAVLDYNKSLAALERAQGTLLEARGMRLEDEGR